jgi:hypothetical protein
MTALLGACTPSPPGGESAESGAASATENAAPIPAASAKPAIAPDETWKGTYVSEAGSLYVVDGGEWAGVTWRGDDASTGIGEGVLALTLEREAHRVTGTGGGSLGDVILVGGVDGETLTASVLRKDPLDRGLTGTAVGKVHGDQIDGTMRLSLADARIIRDAKFTLARSKP